MYKKMSAILNRCISMAVDCDYRLQKLPDERTDLIVKSSLQKPLTGINAQAVRLEGHFIGSQKNASTPVHLGDAKTDERGRLVFFAGRGFSQCVTDPNQPFPLIMTDFDSSDWIDDTCDGRVCVEVIHKDSGQRYVVLRHSWPATQCLLR